MVRNKLVAASLSSALQWILWFDCIGLLMHNDHLPLGGTPQQASVNSCMPKAPPMHPKSTAPALSPASLWQPELLNVQPCFTITYKHPSQQPCLSLRGDCQMFMLHKQWDKFYQHKFYQNRSQFREGFSLTSAANILHWPTRQSPGLQFGATCLQWGKAAHKHWERSSLPTYQLSVLNQGRSYEWYTL